MSTVILIIVVLLLIGALPTWPYSSGMGPLSGRRVGTGPADRGHPCINRQALVRSAVGGLGSELARWTTGLSLRVARWKRSRSDRYTGPPSWSETHYGNERVKQMDGAGLALYSATRRQDLHLTGLSVCDRRPSLKRPS